MSITSTLAYRKAFNEYLRSGTPIDLTLKASSSENPTTHYIWRTRGDGKVRASHAANDGRIFAWDDPPPTGHPGEDYNCRCFAEAYTPEIQEFVSQEVTSVVNDSPYRWALLDLLLHFYKGGGKNVTLSKIGHLQDVIDVARTHVFKGVERQVILAARDIQEGRLYDSFRNSYPFGDVSWAHGSSTIHGHYQGRVVRAGIALHIVVDVAYNFSDIFTDPLDRRERTTGTSDPSGLQADELLRTDLGGTFFRIFDSWTTRITAQICKDKNRSILHRGT
jgi:hypothetical protein